MALSADDALAVLHCARRCVLHAVRNGEADPEPDLEGILSRPAAAFVTLRRRNGALRGCIGRLHADRALGRTLAAMGRAAALADPRFPPVTEGDLGDLQVEVSVISPFEPVTDPLREVRVGEHGVRLVLEEHSGLLLPQVAVELGVDTEGFLELVSRKAGLHGEAWKRPGARVQRFTADVAGPLPLLDH